LIKIVAILLGVIALAGTILIAIADASQKHSNAMGPVAFLACVIAVVVMILLGVTLGGRGNPRRNADGSLKPSRAQLQHAAMQRAAAQQSSAQKPIAQKPIAQQPVPQQSSAHDEGATSEPGAVPTIESIEADQPGAT
jgi:hypothetical protein